MPPLTLLQKRALVAASNSLYKAQKEYIKANHEYASIPWNGWHLRNAAVLKFTTARSKLRNARNILSRLEQKLNVNGSTVNYTTLEKNVISNVLKKHKLTAAPLIARAQEKVWRRGLEAEKKRAIENFSKFSIDPRALSPSPPRRRPSPPRRRPSPPRARGPSPRSSGTKNRETALGIMGGARHAPGSANNTRITWSRNANGKINRFKTLENINLHLTQAQRNALLEMSENKAMNTIRQLARVGH
jgi:hypothetical protein